MIILHPDGTRTEDEVDLSGMSAIDWFATFEGGAVVAYHDPGMWENPEGGQRIVRDAEGVPSMEAETVSMRKPYNEQATKAWYVAMGARIGDELRGDVVIVPL